MTWSSSTCPADGTTVEAGGVLGEVESTKSVSEIYAPVAGEVVAVNAGAGGRARAAQRDPYGEGWICEIAPDGSGRRWTPCWTPAPTGS